jgi:hypothetical protein
MKMKLIWFVIVLLILALLVAIPFVSVNDETIIDLGKGYYYIPYQEVVFDVTAFGGNGIYVYRENFSVPIIFPEIMSYKYDSAHIIIKQKFDLVETKYLLVNILFSNSNHFKYYKELVFLDEKFVKDTKTSFVKVNSENYVDSIMRKDQYISKMIENDYNYYIVDKPFKKVYGPFTKLEYFVWRKKLRISNALQFDD